jgi:hypothetical protein
MELKRKLILQRHFLEGAVSCVFNRERRRV